MHQIEYKLWNYNYEDELARALAEDGSSSSTFITPKNLLPGNLMDKDKIKK